MYVTPFNVRLPVNGKIIVTGMFMLDINPSLIDLRPMPQVKTFSLGGGKEKRV